MTRRRPCSHDSHSLSRKSYLPRPDPPDPTGPTLVEPTSFVPNQLLVPFVLPSRVLGRGAPSGRPGVRIFGVLGSNPYHRAGACAEQCALGILGAQHQMMLWSVAHDSRRANAHAYDAPASLRGGGQPGPSARQAVTEELRRRAARIVGWVPQPHMMLRCGARNRSGNLK